MAFTQQQEQEMLLMLSAYKSGKRITDLPDAGNVNPLNLALEVDDGTGDTSKQAKVSKLLANIGVGTGNVVADASGVVAGDMHAFVPGADGSPTGRFQRLDIPSIPAPLIADVTAMLHTSSAVPTLRAELHGANFEGEAPYIELSAEDMSGITADLSITFDPGLGPVTSRRDPQAVAHDDGTTDFAHVVITKETADTLGKLVVPAACNFFRSRVTVDPDATSNLAKPSYYIDTNGIHHPFSAADTPLTNFCTSGYVDTSITINGQQVVKRSLFAVVFGDDYAGLTKYPDNFLRACLASGGYADLRVFAPTVTEAGHRVLFEAFNGVDINAVLRGFTGVKVFGNFFFADNFAWGITRQPIDFRLLRNAETVGDFFFSYAPGRKSIDISPMTVLRRVGVYFFYGHGELETIQIGSLDFSQIALGADAFYGCPATGTIYADSLTLGRRLQAVAPNLAGWTVVANENPVNQ